MGRPVNRCRSLTTGHMGTYESHSNGWWSILWDGSETGPVETWAPLTRRLVEVVE